MKIIKLIILMTVCLIQLSPLNLTENELLNYIDRLETILLEQKKDLETTMNLNQGLKLQNQDLEIQYKEMQNLNQDLENQLITLQNIRTELMTLNEEQSITIKMLQTSLENLEKESIQAIEKSKEAIDNARKTVNRQQTIIKGLGAVVIVETIIIILFLVFK